MSHLINHINSRYLDIDESTDTVKRWIHNVLEWADDSSKIAWCSIFLMNMMNELCIDHESNASARSWMNFGKEIKDPEYGCIAVLWRGSPTSWKGHVGIYIRETKDRVLLLGGNQSNKVKYSWYLKSRVIGYRQIIESI